MTAPSPQIAVIGAGIGGLAASLLLARAGLSVSLVEKRPKVEEEGAGLQLSPNASRVLVDAGLGPALMARAGAPERVRIRRARQGREIATIPLGERAKARYGAPYLMVHRADLASVLTEAVRGERRISVHYGCEALAMSSASTGGVVELKREGESFELQASALIAADGVWGKIASRRPPRYSGFCAWRGLAPASAVPAFARENEIGLWLGPRAHLVHYPIRGGETVNLVAVTEDPTPREGWSRKGDAERLAAAFAGWSESARELLASVAEWRLWSLFDRDPSSGWTNGAATLLGDAAHPMLPFLAQGAAMAIEDAAILARELAGAPPSNITEALRRYERARFERTARVQREARRNALTYHAPWPFAAARDLFLSASAGDNLLERYDWLYGWRAS
jgi:salicylate hydroxylase